MSTLRALVVLIGVGAVASTSVLAGCAERPGIKKKDDDEDKDKEKKGDKKKDDKKKDAKKDDKKKSE